MGQKVNPNGLRLGINKTWSSKWYAKKNYAKFLHEDLGIKNYVEKKLSNASISKIVIERAAKKYRYNAKIFMLPPWPKIYKSDSERKHSFEDAVKEYEELLIKYKNFGYEVIHVPKMEVEKRINFIEAILLGT